MVGFIKRLIKDRRGNALVITAGALPLLFGSAGLAVDTVQWALWKRQLQRAADSAAYAGVYAKSQSASVDSAVSSDIAKNNKTGITVNSGYPQIAYPTDTGYTNAVQVTLAVQKTLSFSSLFMTSAPVITATGTAAMFDDGEYCMVATKKSLAPGIRLNGGAQATLGCKAKSNSISSSESVKAESSAYLFSTTGISSVGGMPTSITGTSTANLHPYDMPMADPFAGLYPTDIPSGTTCGNQASHVVSTGGGTTTLSPGCYTGNNQFKFTGGNYVLQPGVYYLDSIDFDVGSATITGSGVTIILTGSDPGTLKFNATSAINLTAPTSGTYGKMLFIQSSNADADNSNTINGSSTSKFDGAFYFPNGEVDFSGGAAATTKCAMVVASTIVFSGNANLQNDVSGCVANKTVKGKIIRLIG